MREILADLNTQAQYIGIELSFENYRNLNEADFCEVLRDNIDARLKTALAQRPEIAQRAALENYLGSGALRGVVDWEHYYTRVGQLLFPQRVVLIISDLFDRVINRTQMTQIVLIFADLAACAPLLLNHQPKNQRKSVKSGKSACH